MLEAGHGQRPIGNFTPCYTSIKWDAIMVALRKAPLYSMAVGAVAHNLLSLHEYLNSSLTIFSNFTHLSAVTVTQMCHGSSFQSSLNRICSGHGPRSGLGPELWSCQASRSWKPRGMAGKRKAAGLRERVQPAAVHGFAFARRNISLA